MNNFTKSKLFFLHWDKPTAENLYCNRIPRNYRIGSNRIIKKRKVTKGKSETLNRKTTHNKMTKRNKGASIICILSFSHGIVCLPDTRTQL